MFAIARLVILAALAASLTSLSLAAEKPFQRDDLADGAIRLESQIKAEAGQVAKPLAALRREADAAFERRDSRAGMQILSQMIAVAPNESGNWLRLARAILQVRPTDERERTALLERASSAAYVAYQRAGNRGEQADALVILGRAFGERRLWRPALDAMRLSLELREVAEVRQSYEQIRDQHGFRILDYTVDSDAASPRACFQFSEQLAGKRIDFSPFVAVAGQAKPAISVEDKQLCVEGLKHGERYTVTLRAGLPAIVKETLARSADFNIYVRDRAPLARFASRAYVLPRTGQRGIPVVTVNTEKVEIKIFRVGDRNLIDSVLGYNFQRNLDRYEVERLGDERGVKVWDGELKTESPLNTETTTAFPIDETVRDLAPGVYVMVAEPAGPKANDYGALATQWFIVSDLGLTSFSGNDGITVFLNSLASTDPKTDVDVRLIARNNEVLAARTSDAAGVVRFDAGLSRGNGGLAPALLVASDSKGDYAFLSLKGPAFDLSDRGVSGRATPAGLDAFVYTERGVYRTGESVFITALLRDARGVAVENVPLTIVVERPDGVEYRRSVVADQGAGGRSLSVPIVASAMSGTWHVRTFADPKASAIGATTFLVEDYVPDRLEFELASPTGRISRTQPAELTVDGRYLYGAPAAALELDGEVAVEAAKERPGFPGYQFGVAEEDEQGAERQPLDNLPQTDKNGRAHFAVSLDKEPSATRPLEATITIRMSEPGGRAVERNVVLPVTPSRTMIGVKPLFAGRSLADGDSATFDVAVVAPDGKAQSANGLRYELLRIERRYQWYRQDGRWEYEPVKQTRRVADGALDVAADRPGRIAIPVTWGRYRLDVTSADPDGPTTSVSFDAGWYTEASADAPDLLEIALDKREYRPGESMNVAVSASTGGKLTLSVIGDRLLATKTVDVQAGNAKVPLTVGSDWSTGAYVVATLRRPLDQQAGRMPGRAIGVQWFGVDRAARTLAVNMRLPDIVRPNTALRVPVKIDGLAAGEEAHVVVAAVDVGILNLTGYKPPAPDDYYLGQRRLAVDIRDLYGQLIDGMQGTRGQTRTGGDVASAQLSGSPPTQPPLALYSGIVKVGSDGNAEVQFDIPAFAGTVRVMAVAWNRTRVGRANGDVVVRDPVVLTATLPRFLLTGDRATLRLDLDNVEGAPGDYRITVNADGPLALGGDVARTVRLDARQREGFNLPLSASASSGIGAVAIRVAGPNGLALERTYMLAVKPATQVLTRRTVKPIAKGESLTLSKDLLADLVSGTGSVSVSIGPSTALDAATLIKALDRYPFGCSEQIASRALPLLYVKELASEAQLAFDEALDDRIRHAIERLLARQDSTGAFGLWSANGDDPWLTAYVTDFLSRARERGFTVPDTAFKLALDRLRNFVSTAPDPGKGNGEALAYTLYVLARNGSAPIGDLRYIADTKLGDIKSPTAKAQIAAALGMLGDRARAERAFAAALESLAPTPELLSDRTDYGSTLRDSAALVSLAGEAGASRSLITRAVHQIERARSRSETTSTQESAWLVLAARALAQDAAGVVLDVAGEVRRGPFYRTLKGSDLDTQLKVSNQGEGTLQAVVSVSGAPVTPEPSAENGFKIERHYYTLDGDKADPSTAKQNQRFAVVLQITEGEPQFGRIIVADYLPAGFEIDNPRLVSSGDTGTLSWIQDAAEPVNAEFRDDRFTAAFDRNGKDRPVFTVAYVVRAVSPGRYVLPQAYVEDMYRPDRFGRTATGVVEISAAR
jgi:uncharacterized protein YfaS (alpha-2-macroglobulin family)